MGYGSTALPTPPAIFGLVAARGRVEPAELYEVFNMGVGFCCVVPAAAADEAVALLSERHPGTAVVGAVTGEAGVVRIPAEGLMGTRAGFTGA